MLLHRADMFEALRLTREGKLTEAMTILRGGSSGSGDIKEKGGGQSGSAAQASFIDLVPPSDPTGAWSDGLGDVRGVGNAKPAGESIGTPSFQYHTVRNAAGGRRFKLYVPAGYQGQPLPLIVMLHGCTQSPDDFATGTRMNEFAEAQTFLVAYPEQPTSANPNKCWNWFKEGDQGRDYGEPLLIAELTRQITRDYAVDRERIYVAGMSAGGAAAAIMGATYPDLYAAIGIHSGLACGAARDIPGAFAAMRQGAPAARRFVRNERVVPTIVFHGDRDMTVSPINGDQVSEQAAGVPRVRTHVSRGTTSDGVAFSCTTRYNEMDTAIGEQWVVQGIGHAWSGGSERGSFTDSRGPNASAELVRFFMQHRLIQPNASCDGTPTGQSRSSRSADKGA